MEINETEDKEISCKTFCGSCHKIMIGTMTPACECADEQTRGYHYNAINTEEK